MKKKIVFIFFLIIILAGAFSHWISPFPDGALIPTSAEESRFIKPAELICPAQTEIKSILSRDGEVEWLCLEKGVRRHGPHLSFYKSGKKRSSGQSEHGRQIGVWSTFYENGTLKETVEYREVEGRLGVPKLKVSYDSNGQMIEKVQYNEDGSEPCLAKKVLADDEVIIGTFSGAFLKMKNGQILKQVTGEEIEKISTLYPIQDLKRVAGIQPRWNVSRDEHTGSCIWTVEVPPSAQPNQLFTTSEKVDLQMSEVTPAVKREFREKINTDCVVQGDATDEKCQEPVLFAVTDINHNGKREFWFRSPTMWDTGTEVIEEPNTSLLVVCPHCSD